MDYSKSGKYTKEEWEKKEHLNYEITHEIATKLGMFKDFVTSYSNPRSGKILVEFKGEKFEIEITPDNDFMNGRSFSDFSSYMSNIGFFNPKTNGFREETEVVE